MYRKVALAIFVLSLIRSTVNQENAGSSVAKALIKCYNQTELLDRDSRPPVTMNVFIDLIRKIEDGKSIQDARQFSFEIIHRFRQDGIVKSKDSEGSSQFTLPYSAIGLQADKNSLLLKRFIPGNALNFPNETLNDIEACSLHFMMSNTIELSKRGDEGTTCSRLGRYIRRLKRGVDPNSEVDVFSHTNKQYTKPRGNMQKAKEEVDIIPTTKKGRRTYTFTGEMSDCPIENGVVYSKWGSIQIGTVLAGIATGFEQMNVDYDGFKIDNRFAGTLVGDLVEAAIYQGPKNDVKIGASGGWNSTQLPRHYFVTKNENLYMTDAEVRAGVDGLIIAKSIDTWKKYAPRIKISQILDMYYSQRGVFSEQIRACNRKSYLTTATTSDELKQQANAFGIAFNQEVAHGQTIINEGIEQFTEIAVDKFFEYFPTMADLTCNVETDPIERAAVDLVIVVDTNFEYRIISPYLGSLLDNLDVNRYGSNVTLVNGNDGNIIVNSTSSLSDFFERFNESVHFQQPRGFQFVKVYNALEVMVKNKIDEDMKNNNVGGKATVFLLMPKTTPSEEEKSFMRERKNNHKGYFPEFHIMVLGQGGKDAYKDVVTEQDYDAFTISETTDGSTIFSLVKDISARIKSYPRRISNPKCGSQWKKETSNNFIDQYVEPNTTNYYRIAPNYLFGETEKTLKIRGASSGNLIVCASRDISRPQQDTKGNMDCKNINNNEASYSITNLCKDYSYVSECPAYYFSVQAKQTSGYGCTDNGCRFPDNIKYTITVDGLECTSGANKIFTTLSLLVLAAVFKIFL